MLLPAALFFVASFMVCAAVRSWVVVAVVVTLWTAYIAGVLLGAWGNGVGDGWQYAAVIGTAAAATGAVAGMVARGMVAGARPSPSKSRRATR